MPVSFGNLVIGIVQKETGQTLADSPCVERVRECGLLRRFGALARLDLGLLPGALERFGDQTLLEGAGCHADISNLTIHHRFDALEVGEEPALGDGGDVRADAALLLRLTTAPDVTPLNRAGACQFANACHINSCW